MENRNIVAVFASLTLSESYKSKSTSQKELWPSNLIHSQYYMFIKLKNHMKDNDFTNDEEMYYIFC